MMTSWSFPVQTWRWWKLINDDQEGGAPDRDDQPEGESGGAEHTWTVFLFGRHPARGAFAIAIISFTTWFTKDFTGSSWMAGVAAFVLVASLSNFFFPTRYRIDGESVSVGNLFYRRTRKWSEFRRYRSGRGGVKLLTLPRDSRLDNFRGMLILLPEDGASILEYIRERMPAQESNATA